jgi:hypothetical protein
VEDPIRSIVNVQKLGIEVVSEMLESYYWTRTFKLSRRDIHLLGPFLSTDHFGLGIIPTCYIRHLQIDWQTSLYTQHHGKEVAKSREQTYRRTMEALNVLSTRTEIHFLINSLEDPPEDYECIDNSSLKVMDAYSESMQAAEISRKNGPRITVSYTRAWAK